MIQFYKLSPQLYKYYSYFIAKTLLFYKIYIIFFKNFVKLFAVIYLKSVIII